MLPDKYLTANALSAISQGEQQHIGISKFLAINATNIALGNDRADFSLQLINRSYISHYTFAKNQRGILSSNNQLTTAIFFATLVISPSLAVARGITSIIWLYWLRASRLAII